MGSSPRDRALHGSNGINPTGLHAPRQTPVSDTDQCNSRQVAVGAAELGSYQVCLEGLHICSGQVLLLLLVTHSHKLLPKQELLQGCTHECMHLTLGEDMCCVNNKQTHEQNE